LLLLLILLVLLLSLLFLLRVKLLAVLQDLEGRELAAGHDARAGTGLW